MSENDDSPEISWGKYLGTKKSDKDFYIKPDYDQWLDLEYWDIIEAVYLLNNWHPRAIDYKRDEDGDIISDTKEPIFLKEGMKNTLFWIDYEIHYGILQLINYKLHVNSLLVWAFDKDFCLPKELFIYIKKLKKKKSLTRNVDTILKDFTREVISEFYSKGEKFTYQSVVRELKKPRYKELDFNKFVTPDEKLMISFRTYNKELRERSLKRLQEIIREIKKEFQ